MAHVTRKDRTPNPTEVDERVIPPRDILTRLAKSSAARLEIGREEDIVERVCEADECPGEPNEGRGDADAFRCV